MKRKAQPVLMPPPQSAKAVKVGTRMALAVMVGLLYYLLAQPAADIAASSTLVAVAWPAPTIAIALLWRQPTRTWGPCLLAIAVAMLIVGAEDDLPPLIDAGFACLNVVEVAACAWLGQRYVASDGHIDTLHRLLRFVVLLPLLVVAAVAVGGALLATSLLPSDWWLEWRTFMVGNGLAILVLVPMWLYWFKRCAHTAAERHKASWQTEITALIGMAASIAVVMGSHIGDFSGEVLRALLSLVLAGVALYGGMRSATLSMGTAAVLLVWLKIHGMGPYRHAGLDETWRLQMDLVGMAVLTYLIAVAVRELQVMAVQMEQKRRLAALGLMASGVAHDFNNVLGAAGGYAEIALDALERHVSARPALEQVVAAVTRGRDLTEQILLAARQGDRQRQVLDFRDCVQQAMCLAQPICPAGITIAYTAPAQVMAVQGHSAQLVRLALNLIRNASQAARTQVTVSLAGGHADNADCAVGRCPNGTAVWLDVTDDGSGIEAAHMPHLFEPFFSTRTSGKGTGLGLAIVAAVATEHEGAVAVHSTHEGTTFRVWLPSDSSWGQQWAREQASASAIAQAVPSSDHLTPVSPKGMDAPEHPDPVAAQAPGIPVLGNGEAVWVVDDDPQLCELYEDWLAALGFEPRSFDDPLEALAQFQHTPDDAQMLVVDWDMPQMQGDVLIARILAIAPELPVLLCSGNAAAVSEAPHLGVRSLPKPMDFATFAQAIAMLHSLKQERQA